MTSAWPRSLDDIPQTRRDLGEDAFSFSDAVQQLAEHLLPAPGTVAELNTVVSIEAEWGWGKTSFANLLVAAIQRSLRSDGNRGTRAVPMVVPYNAWLSGPSNGSHWSAIALRIGHALYTEVHDQLIRAADADGPIALELGHPTEPGARITARVTDREQVLHRQSGWTDIAWQLSEAVPATRWHPCLALFGDAPSKLPGRGFSGREAGRSLGRLATRVLESSLKSDQVGAAGAALAAAGSLVGAYSDNGAPAAAESDEFVAHLGTLMRMLRPDARGWRAILVVEDVARLDDDGLASFLEALAYLRHLQGVLVLLCLDRRIADRVLVERGLESGEGRLTKTIDLRQRVPAITWSHRHALVRAWCDSVDLPHADEVAHALGRWCAEHGQASPRQIKRLLRWLDVRLRAHPLDATRPRAQVVSTVLFIASLYRHDALGIGGEELIDSMEQPGAVEQMLLRLPHQPWDRRPWPELAIDPNLEPSSPSARDWIGGLRRFSLIVHLVGPEHPRTMEAEQRLREAWRRHLDRLATESPWVASIVGVRGERPEDAGDKLLARLGGLLSNTAATADLAHQRVRAIRAANVVAAMRSMDVHGKPPSATVAGVCDAWAQGHDLVTLVRRGARADIGDLALLILALLHGSLYDEAVAVLDDRDGSRIRAAADRLHAYTEEILKQVRQT